MKYTQACITQCTNGRWKMFVQSDRQVEFCAYGTLDEIIEELRAASQKEWEKRSIEGR